MLKGIFWIIIGLAIGKFVFWPIFVKSGTNLLGTDWKAVIDKLLKR